MKKFFLAGIILLVSHFAKAQTTVTNNTDCDFKIWLLCYDQNCDYESEVSYYIPGQSTVILPDCPAPQLTGYHIQTNSGCIFAIDTINPCAFPIGSNSYTIPGICTSCAGSIIYYDWDLNTKQINFNY